MGSRGLLGGDELSFFSSPGEVGLFLRIGGPERRWGDFVISKFREFMNTNVLSSSELELRAFTASS